MRKMDEMEHAHTSQAIRIAFLYTIIFEIIYWIIECVNAKEIVTTESSMFFLVTTQGVVLVLSQLFFKNKVVDSKRFFALVIAAVFGLLALGVGFMLAKLGA